MPGANSIVQGHAISILEDGDQRQRNRADDESPKALQFRGPPELLAAR